MAEQRGGKKPIIEVSTDNNNDEVVAGSGQHQAQDHTHLEIPDDENTDALTTTAPRRKTSLLKVHHDGAGAKNNAPERKRSVSFKSQEAEVAVIEPPPTPEFEKISLKDATSENDGLDQEVAKLTDGDAEADEDVEATETPRPPTPPGVSHRKKH